MAGKIGRGVAAEYALSFGLEAIEDRTRGLAVDLRERLARVPGATVQDQGLEKCAIVTFTKADEPAAAVKERLKAAGINVSVSTAQYARLDLEARGLAELVRVSLHYYNTESDLKRFCDTLA